MKDLSLLIWLTQLGLSTAAPLAGFTLVAVWLRGTFDLGSWIIWVGLVLGLCSAVSGFRSSLQAMERMTKDKNEPDSPPVFFNEHH